MGKIKDQVAAFLGFKVNLGEGHNGVSPSLSPTPAPRLHQGSDFSDAHERRLQHDLQEAHPSRQPSASEKRLPALQLPSPKGVSNSLPQRHGSGNASSSLTAPLQIESATLLKLSVSQRNQILHELLKRLLTGPVSSRAAAAESLFNSTSEDELSRQTISTMGAVKPLVELLKLDDVKGQMYAAHTLSALTSFDSSLADMRECQAIAALLHLISSSKSDVSKKGALRALGRLARVDDCASEMVQLGAIPALSKLLDSADGTIVRRCLLTLYFIGADKQDMQDTIAGTDVVMKVVALSTSRQQEIQCEAVDVIKVLSRSRKCADLIMREKGIRILEVCTICVIAAHLQQSGVIQLRCMSCCRISPSHARIRSLVRVLSRPYRDLQRSRRQGSTL
jgi:Kinesin-associated protein (KAP)